MGGIYRIKTRLIFDGYFDVRAETREEAIDYIGKTPICSLDINGRMIGSKITDCSFPIYPEKEIIG